MFKKVLIVLLATLMVVTVCSAKTKLLLWEFMMNDDTANKVIEDYEAMNPDVEIEFVQLSWATGFDKIVTAFAAGAVPDVLELGNTWVANFANEGVLTDISGEVEKFPYIVGWNQSRYDGNYWGYPWLLGTRAMFYNMDLFVKAGLDPENPPETWGELIEAAKKIDALGDDIYGFGMGTGEPQTPWQEWFLPAVWGNNGNILSEDMKTATLNSKEVLEAGKMYQELSKYAIKTKASDLRAVFGSGKVGMWIAQAGDITKLSSTYPDTNFMVCFVPKPDKEDGFHASFAGGEILTIPTASKNKEEAKKLIEYLISEEVTMNITKRVPSIFPSTKKAEENPWFEDHPLEYIFFLQNTQAVPAPQHPKWVDIQFKLSEAIESIVLDYTDVEETFNKYNQQIQAILDEFNGK
ncbi:MAG TPA: extracellular solute-binding protein [Thermotogota bacterium]|nr:extracellular solute-binding protein [Thermotogota bacterium]HPJ89496.1 extracellular solute-binding protein [Thermotogota bacterium]HPR96388.1 extracellular solute-binding protein [Thermotogota bacterium]